MSGPLRRPVPKLHKDPSYVPPAPLEAAEGPLVAYSMVGAEVLVCTACGAEVKERIMEPIETTTMGDPHPNYVPGPVSNRPCGCYATVSLQEVTR